MRRWMWFVGMYIIGIISIGTIAFLIRSILI